MKKLGAKALRLSRSESSQDWRRAKGREQRSREQRDTKTKRYEGELMLEGYAS